MSIQSIVQSSASVNTFNFGQHIVRTAGTAERPLFCAGDVCDVLGLDNVSQACSRLKECHLERIIPNDIGGNAAKPACPPQRPMLYVTEPGLYRLISSSRKPEAEAFQDWIAEEVLPSIRKTGQYSARALTPAEQLLAIVQLTVDQERRAAEHQSRIEALESAEERRTILEESAGAALLALPHASVDVPSKTQRALLNEAVRLYAVKAGGGKAFGDAWRKLYRELYSRCSIDVKKQAKNRGVDALDVVEQKGLLEQLYAIALEVLQ